MRCDPRYEKKPTDKVGEGTIKLDGAKMRRFRVKFKKGAEWKDRLMS